MSWQYLITILGTSQNKFGSFHVRQESDFSNSVISQARLHCSQSLQMQYIPTPIKLLNRADKVASTKSNLKFLRYEKDQYLHKRKITLIWTFYRTLKNYQNQLCIN